MTRLAKLVLGCLFLLKALSMMSVKSQEKRVFSFPTMFHLHPPPNRHFESLRKSRGSRPTIHRGK